MSSAPDPDLSSSVSLEPESLQAILFDVDETLFDRRRAQHLVLQQMHQRLSPLLDSVSDDELSRAWAASDRATENHVFNVGDRIREARDERSRILLQELGLTAGASETAAVTDAYLDLYGVVEAPMQGARQVVEACGRHFRIGVVSNAYPDVQYRKLDTLGLRQAFACIVLSEEYGTRKPEPGIFQEGCRRLCVEPARCLYVGDSYTNDVIGAAAAGLPCCWLNPTGESAPGAALPQARIRRLPDLLDLLELTTD